MENLTAVANGISNPGLVVASVDEDSDNIKPELEILHISETNLRILAIRCFSQFLTSIGERTEVLAPLLRHQGIETLISLLTSKEVQSRPMVTCEVLHLSRT